MTTTYLPLPTLSRTTYEDVIESIYLLSVYSADLMDLRDYLHQRTQSSSDWADVLYRLNTDISVALKKSTQDIAYLDTVDAFNVVEKYDVNDSAIPWYFLGMPYICRSVLNRTHPLVKLYDKYQYLFVDIVESGGCTLYIPRKLF